jgi:two-component system, chemotaxis family, chemotaxis protein CheY
MRKTILCVDDSISMRQWVVLALSDEGYNVITAEDGNDAAARIKNTPIDLVLTDLIQPNTDGIALTKQIRSMQRYQMMPILIMTTEAQRYRKYEGKNAGASGWIEKPFTREQLRNILRHFAC